MATETNHAIKYPLHLQFFADGGDGDPQDPPKKIELTQEELDAMIAKRLGQERKKFADYDDVKTKLTALEQAEEDRKKAAMTEQERLEAEKAAALKKAQEVEDTAQKTLSSANQRLIKTEFRAIARESGIRSDALDDAFKLADVSTVTVDDDGNVLGVDDVVKTLIEQKPFLIEKKHQQPIGGNTNPSNNQTTDLSKMTTQQLLSAGYSSK